MSSRLPARLYLPVNFVRLACGAVLASVFAAYSALACVIIPPPPPRPEIKPLYLEIKSQHVETIIVDQTARTTVTTVLHNPHERAVEGTFLFPVPADAYVSDFSYWIGDKEIKGELLDRDKARRIYEEIVRQLRDPALLEYTGQGLFQARIFPIAAHGEAQTKLQYTQLLRGENGLVRFRHAVKLGRTNPNRGTLVIDVTIRSQTPVKSVYSPTHKLDVTRKSDHEIRVGVELDHTDFNTDFELIYTLTEKDFGVNVLTHRPAGESGYFMLLLAPKQEWAQEEIANKDVVFALDTSGSMSGEKISQAKKAFAYCLNALRPDDRFGLLTFATEVRLFAEKLLPANSENVKRAIDFVNKLEATGSTALNEALVRSVELFEEDRERPRMILFLTDGLPTAGERNVEKIIQNVARANRTRTEDKPEERRARFFVFGVGDDVNTHLLDKIAEENGGASHYVRPQEDIEEAVSSLYAKLSHPVLANVKLQYGAAKAFDIYPQKLPDLFLGSQLIVTGRYEGNGPTEIVLTGTARGKEVQYAYNVEFPREEAENAFVARIWAGRRIGYLLDQIRLHGEDKELKDEIVQLAIKFGIVTPYTSYLVQEDENLRRRAERLQAAFGKAAEAPQGAVGPIGPAGPAPAAPQEALRAAVGAGAVHAAQSTRALKEAAQQESQYQGYKHVGQRTFYLDGEIWKDTTWRPETKVLRLKAFSEAYFALLRVRPDLAPYLALGPYVYVQLPHIGLAIEAEGAEQLKAADIEELQK